MARMVTLVEPWLHEFIVRSAAAHHMTASDFVRDALKEVYNGNEDFASGPPKSEC